MPKIPNNPVSAYNWLTDKQFTKDEVEKVICPSCESGGYKTIATERSVIGVVKCRACGLIYVNPRLKSPEKIYWGDEEDYFEEAKLIFAGKKPHHRDGNYLDDLKIIRRFKPEGNFLDIGTNAGFFLRLAQENPGWNIYGVEPSKPLANLAARYFNLNIRNAFLEEAGFNADFFDIVTMTDVFEHIPNPAAVLKEVHRIMRKDGILFIKVPNVLFSLFKFSLAKLTNTLGAYDIFNSYEHLIHYSQATLTRMLTENGFTLVYKGIGRPIQTPCWQKYTGTYYQYPMPWILDWKNQLLRNLFYAIGMAEYFFLGLKAGYFSSNIIVVAKKA